MGCCARVFLGHAFVCWNMGSVCVLEWCVCVCPKPHSMVQISPLDNNWVEILVLTSFSPFMHSSYQKGGVYIPHLKGGRFFNPQSYRGLGVPHPPILFERRVSHNPPPNLFEGSSKITPIILPERPVGTTSPPLLKLGGSGIMHLSWGPLCFR